MIPIPESVMPRTAPCEQLKTEAQAVWVERALAQMPVFIAQLSVPEREVIIRHYFDGRDLPEIAAELGLEREAAHSLLRRGLTLLRKALEKGQM